MIIITNNNLATWFEELTHWKRPWCWVRLKVGGEGDDRGWDGWMASPTQWTWIWVSSSSWWWTGKPGVLQSMGLQRVRHNWVTALNWTDNKSNEKQVKETVSNMESELASSQQQEGYFETLVSHLLGQLAFCMKSYSFLQQLGPWVYWPLVQRAEWAWSW